MKFLKSLGLIGLYNSILLGNLRLLSIDKHVALYFCKTFEGNVKIDFEHTEWAWVERSNLSPYDTVPRLKELYELGMMYGNKENN